MFEDIVCEVGELGARAVYEPKDTDLRISVTFLHESKVEGREDMLFTRIFSEWSTDNCAVVRAATHLPTHMELFA